MEYTLKIEELFKNQYSKLDIERQIKGYIGLRNMARNHGENETVEKFENLINEKIKEIELLYYNTKI
jgi:hypothetical protein